jgi:hypothetical protein
MLYFVCIAPTILQEAVHGQESKGGSQNDSAWRLAGWILKAKGTRRQKKQAPAKGKLLPKAHTG